MESGTINDTDLKVEKEPAIAPNSGGPGTFSMKNRELRHQHYVKFRKEKKKDKKKRREARQKEAEALGENAPPKQIPKTIESMREADETTVAAADVPEEDQDEEVTWDIANDEFKDYFSKTYEPKVLITSADNPHKVKSSFSKQTSRFPYIGSWCVLFPVLTQL